MERKLYIVKQLCIDLFIMILSCCYPYHGCKRGDLQVQVVVPVSNEVVSCKVDSYSLLPRFSPLSLSYISTYILHTRTCVLTRMMQKSNMSNQNNRPPANQPNPSAK